MAGLLERKYVASSITNDYPELLVSTFSYHGSEPPPTGDVKGGDNVVVRVCDTRSNQALGREEPGNTGFRDRLAAWSKYARHLSVWDYAITYTPAFDGLPYASELHFADYYRMCRRYGVLGFFREHESCYRTDAFELKFFMETHLMENPDLDANALIRRFMSEYYGKAGEIMLRYRQGLDETLRRNGGNIYWFPTLDHWNWITAKDIETFQAMFDEAERLVADDPRLTLRVRRLRYGLDRLVCLRNQLNPNPDNELVKVSADRIRATLAAWYAAYARRFPQKVLPTNAEEDAASAVGLPPPKVFAGRAIRDFPSSLLSASDADRTSVFTDDPDSETKRALRIDADSSHHYDFPYMPGVYDEKLRCGLVTAHFDKPLADGRYAWYGVGVATITPDAFVHLSGSWIHRLRLKFHPEMHGKRYAIFVSAKFTGRKYQAGSTDPSRIWIDRVILVPTKAIAWEEKAWKSVMTRFFEPKTSLLYDFRTGEGVEGLTGCLPTPEEIKAMKPCPTGWKSGMEDSVLNGTSLTLAGIVKWEKTHDCRTKDDVVKLLSGLLACGRVSGIPGFLARSFSPVDGRSFFPDSSRDQYTQFVYTLWRFCRSDLSSVWDMKALRKECVRQLCDVASYAEKCVRKENGWCLLRTDGVKGRVSQMWTSTPGRIADEKVPIHGFGGICVHEALRLPMFYAAAHDLTRDGHWREMTLRYADDGIRMANGRWSESGMGFCIYQAQFSHRLLFETERDPVRKESYRNLLEKFAGYAPYSVLHCNRHANALGRNASVYGTDWRKLPTMRDGGWIPGWSTVPVWKDDFTHAFEYLREASECMLNAQLYDGRAPCACEETFNRVFSRLDYDRVTTVAGVAQALLAFWIREQADGPKP